DPMAGEAEYQQPGRSGDADRGQDHEPAGDRGFDGDHPRSSVRYREPDVDRCDQGHRQRIDGRRVQPPKAERCRGLDDAPDNPPQHRCPQRPPREWAGRWWERYRRFRRLTAAGTSTMAMAAAAV